MPYSRRIKKYCTNHPRLIFLVLTLLLLSSIIGLRTLNDRPAMATEKPYFYLSLAESYIQPSLENAELAKNNLLDPFEITLLLSIIAFGKAALLLLPAALTFLSALLLFEILKILKRSFLERFLATLIFIISPLSIHTLLIADSITMALFLQLLALFVLLRKNTHFAFPLTLYAIISFFGPVHIIVSLIVVFLFCKTKKSYTLLYWLAFIEGIVVVSYQIPVRLFRAGIKEFVVDAAHLTSFISDFGGSYGFSIFVLALAGIGLAILYKKQYLLLILILFAGVTISFFNSEFRIYANVITSILAAITMTLIVERKYSLKKIRDFSIILILCGLLFGTLSFSNRVMEFAPTSDTIQALEEMQNLPPGSRILSHRHNGFWIRSIGRQIPIEDSLAPPSTQEVWYSWDLKRTKTLLNVLNATHIFITPDMVSGSTWGKPQQALHFLLKDSETFKNVYQVNHTEIWQVLPSEND